MAKEIELILLKDNKHLGKKGTVFTAFQEQADYFIKNKIAARNEAKGAETKAGQPEPKKDKPKDKK